MHPDADVPARTDQTAELEQALILEFLEQRGLTLATLHTLPSSEAHDLLRQASTYASAKLAEVESRWRYVEGIHDVTNHGD